MFTLYKKDNDIHSGFHTKLSISRHGVSRHFCGREKELDSTCRNVVKSSSFITEKNMISPVYEKYKLTYMEFTVLMFLANNPQYNTATQIVRYRHLAKSHVSISIRSLQERGLILGEHKGGNHRTIHLSVSDKARDIIAVGRAAQNKFCEIVFAGFSKEEMEKLQQFTEQVNRNIKEYTNS